MAKLESGRVTGPLRRRSGENGLLVYELVDGTSLAAPCKEHGPRPRRFNKNSIRSSEPSHGRTRQIGTFYAAGARKSAAAAMKNHRKRVILALEPGLYLVSADFSKTRVWKTDGFLVVGHGSKLRRSILKKIFNKLLHAAHRVDAIVERKKRRHAAT